MNMPRGFVPAAQAYIARASITPSTARGPGTAGTASRGRKFLASLPLKQFGISNERRFGERLDAATEALLNSLPARARRWGRARKMLNIFLRNALYSRYLSRRFDLDRAACYFELPLDQVTAGELKRRYPELPVWPGVAALDPEISRQYQAAAQEEGRRRGLTRVHLDVYWFGAERADRH